MDFTKKFAIRTISQLRTDICSCSKTCQLFQRLVNFNQRVVNFNQWVVNFYQRLDNFYLSTFQRVANFFKDLSTFSKTCQLQSKLKIHNSLIKVDNSLIYKSLIEVDTFWKMLKKLFKVDNWRKKWQNKLTKKCDNLKNFLVLSSITPT